MALAFDIVSEEKPWFDKQGDRMLTNKDNPYGKWKRNFPLTTWLKKRNYDQCSGNQVVVGHNGKNTSATMFKTRGDGRFFPSFLPSLPPFHQIQYWTIFIQQLLKSPSFLHGKKEENVTLFEVWSYWGWWVVQGMQYAWKIQEMEPSFSLKIWRLPLEKPRHNNRGVVWCWAGDYKRHQLSDCNFSRMILLHGVYL